MRKPTVTTADTPIDTVRDLLIGDSTGLLIVLGAEGTVAGYITALTALAAQTEPAPGPRGGLRP